MARMCALPAAFCNMLLGEDDPRDGDDKRSKGSKAFAIAAQWAREKMGNTQRSIEDPAFIETCKLLKATAAEIQALDKSIANLQKRYHSQDVASDKLQDSLRSRILHQDPSEAPETDEDQPLPSLSSSAGHVRDAVSDFTTVHLALREHRLALRSAFDALAADVHSLLQTEVREASRLKAEFDLAHLAKDAAWAKLEERKMSQKPDAASLIREAEEAKSHAESRYAVLRKELLDACERMTQRKDFVLTQRLQAYADAQLQYLSRATASFGDVA